MQRNSLNPDSKCGFGNYPKFRLDFIDLPTAQVSIRGGPKFPPALGIVRNVCGCRPKRSQLSLWQIHRGRIEPAVFDVDQEKPRQSSADWDRPHEFSRQTRGWDARRFRACPASSPPDRARDGRRPERSQRPRWPSSQTKPTAIVADVRNEANGPNGRPPKRSQLPLWQMSGTKPTAPMAVLRNEANRPHGRLPERSQPPLGPSSGTKPTALMAGFRNEANRPWGRRPERSQRPLWQTGHRDLATATRCGGIEVRVGFRCRPRFGERSGVPRDFGGRSVELRGSRVNRGHPGRVAEISRSTGLARGAGGGKRLALPILIRSESSET